MNFQDGANLDLDFFNQIGIAESRITPSLTRDSLYVKFDPIVGAIVSNTVDDKFAMPPPPVPVLQKNRSVWLVNSCLL